MKRLAAAALVALAAGCADPGGITHRSEMAVPASLHAEETVARESAQAEWPTLDWWKRFGDPQLDALVEEALAGSPSARLAQARVDQAVAAAEVAGAPLGVKAGADGSLVRQRFSENYIFPPPIGGASYLTTQLSANVAYQLDVWGKNRAAYEAALGRGRAAEADAFTARLALSSAVAATYVQLARAFEQRDLAERELHDRVELQRLTDDRVRAGLDSRLQLKQVETGIPAARAALAQRDEEIALARHQLAALLGKGPDRGLSLARPTLRMTSVALPSRVPAELLGRRPDVLASRLRAQAAARDIDSQKAQFYPDINLSALVGVQTVTLSKLLDAGSLIPQAGIAASLPILDGGRLRGALAARNADYDVAVEQYNQTLADALREVVDQLTSLHSVNVQRSEVASALASAEDAYSLAVTRYKAGIGSLLDVLAAESAVLEQRTRHTDLQARELALSINLIRALGGGYEAKVAMQ